MPRFDNAIVLVTRPKDSAARFVSALSDAAGPFQPVISPAFENVRIDADIPDFDTAIFTSGAGVSFAPEGRGRIALCVGAVTAEIAKQAGYRSVSANGNADDLINLILTHDQLGRLLHIRGEVSHGDISATLRHAGQTCSDAVVYRKQPRPPTVDAVASFQCGQPILLPLFSAETVSIIADWRIDLRHIHIVAISGSVGTVAAQLSPASLHLSAHPNLASMVDATASLIA